jgi:hypothetical protein
MNCSYQTTPPPRCLKDTERAAYEDADEAGGVGHGLLAFYTFCK